MVQSRKLAINSMSDAAQSACKHSRTRLIAKDNDAQYVECLDCGVILEAAELKENSAAKNDSPESPGGESLSDA